jgi:hypothetical protein
MIDAAAATTRVIRTAPTRAGPPAIEPAKPASALESVDIQRIFAVEDARWRPGGYEYAEPRETMPARQPERKRRSYRRTT